MSPSNDETAGTSFLGLVLECNSQDPSHDSFSTLGLHSIFSEDDFRRVQQRQQEKAEKQRLEKFSEEEASLGGEEHMDLQSLLQKGRALENDANKGHKSFSEVEGSRALFQGDRWLESAGKSVSCRNLAYDHSEMGDSGEDHRRVCTDAVSEAIHLTAGPAAPLLGHMDVSGTSISTLGLSEADDIDESKSQKSRSVSRRQRWTGGVRGLSQSCRNFSAKEREEAEEAAKALSALNKRNAVNRRSMLGMAKPLSARNLGKDTPPTPSARRPIMKSKSVRHFTDREREAQLSPMKRPSRPGLPSRQNSVRLTSPRCLPSRTKSVRQLRRSKTTLGTSPASFNGRKFVSYSRSLSCREFQTEDSNDNTEFSTEDDNVELDLTPTDDSEETDNTQSETPQSDTPTTVSESGEVKPRRGSFTRTFSGFLKKRVQNEKITKAVAPKPPKNRRSLLAGAGRSMSARYMLGGRKSMLSMGRSLSARNLTQDEEEEDLPALAKMPLIPASPKTGSLSAHLAVSPSTPMMTPLSVCMEESTCHEESTTDMDDSMPGLSPMITPGKPSPSADLLQHKSTSSLQVEEELWASLSNLPLTDDNVGANNTPVPECKASPLSQGEGTKPVFSTEEIRKEIGSVLDSPVQKGDALSTIRESGAAPHRSVRRGQSSRRLSKTETTTASAGPEGTQSSLKAALHKSSATSDRRKSTSKSRRSSLKASSQEDQTARRSSKKSYSRTVSYDSNASSVKSSSQRKPSSLKNALNKSSHHGKSLDSSSELKSPKGRRLSSSHKQHSSRHLKKEDKQRSSRHLSKKESQRDLSVSRHESSRQHRQRSSRHLVKKESQRNMSVSETGGRTERQRSSRNLMRKDSQRNMSHEIGRPEKQRSSRHLTKKDSHRKLSVSMNEKGRRRASLDDKMAASAQHNSIQPRSMHSEKTHTTFEMSMSSRDSDMMAGRQKSRRQLSMDEPTEKRRSSLRKKESSRRGLRKSKSLRQDSPNCVANYSPDEKESPQGRKKVKERRKKRKSLLDKLESAESRRCQKELEDSQRAEEAARLGVNMRDLEFANGYRHGGLSRHCSWSTTEFSSVVW